MGKIGLIHWSKVWGGTELGWTTENGQGRMQGFVWLVCMSLKKTYSIPQFMIAEWCSMCLYKPIKSSYLRLLEPHHSAQLCHVGMHGQVDSCPVSASWMGWSQPSTILQQREGITVSHPDITWWLRGQSNAKSLNTGTLWYFNCIYVRVKNKCIY